MPKTKHSARDKFGKDQRLSVAAWNERYRVGDTAWDMKRVARPLERISRLANAYGKSVLITGCGRGFEARLFARLGADVVGADFSALALEEAAKLSPDNIRWEMADVRALPPAWSQRFDFVVEHCCFCAIAPADRRIYVSEMHRVLKPSGRLIGLFFVDFDNPDGPPFGIFQYKLRPMLAEFFQILYWEGSVPDSFPSRQNHEALVIAQKIS